MAVTVFSIHKTSVENKLGNISRQLGDRRTPSRSITAVVNSIDRSTEDRAPNRCLPFDGIGARHPG